MRPKTFMLLFAAIFMITTVSACDVEPGIFTLRDNVEKTYIVMDVDCNGYYNADLYYKAGDEYIDSRMNIWGILTSIGFYGGYVGEQKPENIINGYMDFDLEAWKVNTPSGGYMAGTIHKGNLVA